MWLTTPWLLAGLGLLALPVAAHLMSRRARRVVVFPSVALLAEAAVRQGRGLVVRRWLLLMLRSLAVAAVVLAFCRPMVAVGAREGERAAGGAVVVVLDAGASMGWRLEGAGGATAMQLGKAAADGALGEAEAAGAPAGLVVGGLSAESVFDRPTRNVAALRAALAAVEATAGTGSMTAALAEGRRLLAQAVRTTGGPGRLVVVSDLQATTWSAVAEAGVASDGLAGAVEVVDATRGRDGRGNAGVSELWIEPAVARPGEAAVVSGVVVGSGLAGTRAELWVDGQRVGERGLRFTGEEATAVAVSFDLPAGKAGASREVALRLTGDGMAADDAGYAVARTGEAAAVRLIGSARGRADPSSPGYYVARALAPRGGEGDRFAVMTGGVEGSVVVVVGDAALSTAEAERLAAWVDRGGGLLVISDATSGAGLSALWEAGLLPASIGDWGAGGAGDAGLVPTARGERMLAGLGPTAWSALERARPGGGWRTGVGAMGAEVLAEHADGSVALGVMPVGRGRVAWVNASVVPSQGGLGRRGAWVGVMQAVAGWAARDATEDAERGLTVGAVVSDGAALRRLEQPGVVKLASGEEGERWVAVNPDASESAADRWSVERASAWLAGEGEGTAAAGVSGVATAVDAGRVGEPVWGWVLMIGAGLLAVEAGIVG
ncbi:MAG: BatA domain-containing protein, partial [Planctomycetota bacterium]